MHNRKLKVPGKVYKKVKTLGEIGQKWLDDLDDLINSLEEKWEIKVGRVLSGGSEAFVAEAITEDNRKFVLKIVMPAMSGNTIFERELRALILVDGNGYVSLIKFDEKLRALLLERLGLSLRSINPPINQQIEIICNILEKTWIDVSEPTQFTSEKSIFTEFCDLINDLYKDISIFSCEKTVHKALELCRSRALSFNPRDAVLVHGDAHSANLLQVNSDNKQGKFQFKLIDPDGIVCEPAYDLGVLMREWIDELVKNPVYIGSKRCQYISKLTNISPKAIWEWGLIQCVSTGLLLIKVGQKQEGIKLLNVANSWVDSCECLF